MTPVRRATVLGVFAIFLAFEVAAQSCSTACQNQPNGKDGPAAGTTVTVAFGAGFSAEDIASFREGIEMWNAAFLASYTDLWFDSYVYGPGHITILINPNDQSGGAFNDTDDSGYGAIWVSPRFLNRNMTAFWRHVIAHELGHSLGFANVDDGNCQSQTIMYEQIGQYGPFLSSIPTCDHEGLAQEYPSSISPSPPPHRPDPLEWQEWCTPWCVGSPLVLDLNGDGILTTTLSNGVSFDIDGDGQKELLGWTAANSEDAFLWLDLNANHNVDGGNELFGVGALLASGEKAPHGFAALASYDDPARGGNGDGTITAADRVWGRLRLWTDRNHDALSQADEILPIHAAGVRGLYLTVVLDVSIDESGNLQRLKGRYRKLITAGGAAYYEDRALVDVFFVREP